MKKYVILSSVLALAACGGGSSGGGAVDPIVTPTNAAAFERAAASNKEVTGMVSRIQKGDSYAAIGGAARAATGMHSDGAYYLDNVLFQSADKEFGDPRDDFSFHFKTDENGKIIGMYVTDDATKEDGSVDELMNRVGDENKFDFDDAYGKLNLLGAQLGMKYSDFGFLEMYDADDPDHAMFIMPIAGGYEAKNVTPNKDDFGNDVVFNGTAVGSVGEASTAVEGDRLTLSDTAATLTFRKDSGDQVLSAKFDNWYDVTATQYHDGDAQIKFANGDHIKDDKFRFQSDGATVNAFDTGKVANNSAQHLLSVGFEYYGDSAKDPREATGLVFYSQENGPTDNDSVDFFMGFGGARK
ncbi:hypothetical protein HDR63_03305 [bacterium]|nr:hypothetical protein [bacterium]